MLFHRRTAASALDAYLAAEGGDPSGLALISLAYDFMIHSVVTWGDWAAKGSIDYDPARDWFTDMNLPGSIMGSPTLLLVGGAAQLRGGWHAAPMPDENIGWTMHKVFRPRSYNFIESHWTEH